MSPRGKVHRNEWPPAGGAQGGAPGARGAQTAGMITSLGADEPQLSPEPVAATLPGLVPGLGPDGRPRPDAPLAAVTGVTGYVGGRLVPELLAAGYRVRALARNPDRLRGRPWADGVVGAGADGADGAGADGPDAAAAAVE